MSACNWCGYNADYIKENSKKIEDKLCGACLNAVNRKDLSYEDLLNKKEGEQDG